MQPRERLLQQAAAGRGAAAGRAGRQRRHALCQRRPLKWPLGLKVLQQRHRLAAVAAAAVRPPGAARGRDVVHAAEWAGVVGLAQPAAIVGRELERALRRARVRDRHAAHAAPTEPCLSYSAQN